MSKSTGTIVSRKDGEIAIITPDLSYLTCTTMDFAGQLPMLGAVVQFVTMGTRAAFVSIVE